MLDRFRSYLTHFPKLMGIEMLLGDGGQLEVNLAEVHRRFFRVYFSRGANGLTAYRAIKDHLPEGVPAVLCLGGRGVMHRIMGEEPVSAPGEMLRQVFPDAKAEDFYVQHTKLESTSLVSIIRRDLVDGILLQLGALGIPVLKVVLGPFAIALFNDYLDAQKSLQQVGRHQFSYSERSLVDYRLLPETDLPQIGNIRLGGEEMDERTIAAFALGFACISDLPIAELPHAGTGIRMSEYQGRGQFKRSGVFLLSFFLAALLLNAVFFAHYTNRVARFAGNDTRAIQQEIKALEAQHAERSALLESLWPSGSPNWEMAFLADRLASTCPTSVRFAELAIYPKDEAESRKRRHPVHIPSVIRIGGNCNDMSQLNDWIKQLRELRACATVKLETYQLDEQRGTGIFSLLITLRS